jgi:phage terminase large subunit-like protein|nr:MAG TPA: Large Terminase [Caudoviricetes sp.]
MKPYIVQYYEAIKTGFIEIDGKQVRLVVGSKIKKVIERLISYFDDERILFDPKECYKRFEFEESMCLQGYAPFFNKPISLMLWQKAFYEAIYSFYDKQTGLLLINEALLEVGRKNGKSTMVAADGNTDLFIGEGGINICCCSNDDRQAKLIWSEVAGMRSRLDPKNEVTSHNLTEIRNNAKNIKILRLSSKTQNKDGFNFKKTYHDEAHDCKNDDIAEACLRSMSTHDEHLYVTVSTNGFLNEMYFDKKLEYANAWLNGEIDNIHYLPFLFEQDDESEVWSGNRDLWQKANPSLIYGVKKWSFIEQNIIKAQIDKESRMHLLTKDFNIKVSNSKAWLTLEEYDYEQQPFTLKDFRECVALGSVDLSDCGDLTVAELLLMRKGNSVKYVVPQFFIPESKLEDKDNGAKYKEWSQTINPVTGDPYVIVIKGNKINQKNVADWYQSLRDKYAIETIMIGYDPWHSDIFLMWCDKKTGYGFNTMKIYQNSKLMSYPMKTVERDLNARLINYCNNPVMKYCFNNMSAKIVGDLIMPEKIDGQYSRKIDGVVALIILYATLEKNEVNFNNYLRE